MTYRALLIGNSTFEADASLNPLNAPVKDVARLHRALVDTDVGMFDDIDVRLVTERTSDDLLDELDIFFESAERDDLLLLYYSGHGLLDHRGQLYLCGRNTRSDKLLRTAVSNVRIDEFIGQSAARCTVIVLDCCASGMFKGGDVGLPLAGPGRYVISSTRGSALANDAATATGTSLFTEFLVAGLLTGAEDRDGDGYVDLRDLFDFVRAGLTSTTKQIPHCRFDGDAQVRLARRRARSSAPRSSGLTFTLSENSIVIRDVDPGERLRDEIVEIYPAGSESVDCAVETSGNWLMAEVRGNHVIIRMNPREGPNRSRIMVRDRNSGAARVLRVEVHVRRRGPATLPPDSPASPPLPESSSSEAPSFEAPSVKAPMLESPAKGSARGTAPMRPPRTPASPLKPHGKRHDRVALVLAILSLLTSWFGLGLLLLLLSLLFATWAERGPHDRRLLWATRVIGVISVGSFLVVTFFR